MEIVAATNNAGKLRELGRILAPYGHTVLPMQGVGVRELPPEEGESFAQNALAKARSACDACGLPCLGDDSGLEVDALSGAPGIFSARFAGEHSSDAANNRRLLYLLERTPYAKRTARFVCAVALAMPNGSHMGAEGVCEGIIGFAPAGEGGFGYDPLFYVGSHSFAAMTDAEKDAVSHRAAALRGLMEKLKAAAETAADSPLTNY